MKQIISVRERERECVCVCVCHRETETERYSEMKRATYEDVETVSIE